MQIDTVTMRTVMTTGGMEASKKSRLAYGSRPLECNMGAQVYKQANQQASANYYSDDENGGDH